MVTPMYSIYDERSKMYQAPVVRMNDSVAMRDFETSVKSEGMMAKFPEDFSLFCVGAWDDEKGVVVAVAPSRIAHAMDVIRKILGAGADPRKVA